jgi:hypothetical protein
LLLFEVLE